MRAEEEGIVLDKDKPAMRHKISPLQLLMGLLLGVLALILSCSMATADATRYTTQTRQIKACVLVSNATSRVANGQVIKNDPVPYLFYALDARTDYKPAGWQFVNPLAPSTITQDIYNRWLARQINPDPAFQNGTPQSLIFRVGAPVSKNMGAYWEEDLDTISQQALDSYNIAFLPLQGGRLGTGTIQFDENEVEKLRQFVDSGGILWIENDGAAGFTNDGGNFLFPLQLTSAADSLSLNILQPLSTLFNDPYPLSVADTANFVHTFSGSIFTALGGGLVDPHTVTPLLGTTVPFVYAGNYGAGHILLSGVGIAAAINAALGAPNPISVTGSANDGAVSGDTVIAVPTTPLKFAYNVAAWTGAMPAANANSHRDASTQEIIGANLETAWATVPLNNPPNPGSGVAIDQNVAAYVDGNNGLHVYNLHPGQALTGFSLFSDNGIPDFVYGTPYDEIWNTFLGANGRYATPLLASVTNPANGQTVEICAVTNSLGVTGVFNALPGFPGPLQSTSPLLFQIGQAGQPDAAIDDTTSLLEPLPVPAPAYAGGVLFAPVYDNANNDAGHAWHVVAVDLLGSLEAGQTVNAFSNNANGVAPSVAPSALANGLADLVGPLTVGWVPDQQTGAEDEVVYAAAQAEPNGAPASQGQIVGLWFATKNEPLQPVDQPKNGLNFQFEPHGARAWVPWYVTAPSGANTLDLTPVVHVTETDTNTGNVIDVKTYHLSDGVFTVSYNGPPPPDGTGSPSGHQMVVTFNANNGILLNDTQNHIVRTVSVDYTLDWPGDAINGISPSQQDMQIFIQRRTFTLYPESSVSSPHYLTGGVVMDNQGAAVFASSPQGLTDKVLIAGNPLPDRIYSVTGQYSTLSGPTSGQVVNWMFSPMYGGTFDGNTIRPRLVYTDPTTNVQAPIVQFRVIGQPALQSGMVYVVGVATDANGDKFTAILALNSQINPIVPLNPPILYKTSPTAAPVQLAVQQPDFVNSSTSPAYITLPAGTGYTLDTQTDTNGQVFVTAIRILNMRPINGIDAFNTALPIFISLGNTGVRQAIYGSNGFGPLDNLAWYLLIPTFGVQATPLPASGPTVAAQTLYYGTVDGRIAAVDLNAAQQGKISVRVITTLTNPSNGSPLTQVVINPPAAAQGIVAVGSGAGIAALNNQLTVVADANRILEVDAGGNAVWSLNTTQAVSVNGNTISAVRVPFRQPSSLSQLGEGNYVVADSGNNRVVVFDPSGTVLQEITTFNNDIQALRPGEPLALNHPTDAQIYTDSQTNGTITILSRITGVTYTYTGPYYAVHYVIADAGNYRAIEIVDVFNPNTGQYIQLQPNNANYPAVTMYHQVIFTTRSLGEQNGSFRYRTIQQFVDPTNPNQIDMVAAVSDVSLPTVSGGQTVADPLSNQESLGGALMILSRYSYFGPNGNTDGNVIASLSQLKLYNAQGQFVSYVPVSNPVFFRAFPYTDPKTGNRTIHYLLADNAGCYELAPDADGKNLDIVWQLTDADYYYLTGRHLHAVSIQRLPQADYSPVLGRFVPHYLITNAYTGPDNVVEAFGNYPNVRDGEVHGEVFEIRGIDYYATATGPDGIYNGYQNAGRLYAPGPGPAPFQNQTLLLGNPLSCIVRMVPHETLIQTDAVGNLLQLPILRSISFTGSNASSFTLQDPKASLQP
ncbi:hypothetical protein CWRG_02893 [Chthonomonas calidirosea]|nr:hypothetical protein CWRG_02893 [Chthonomonas calidirosea]